MLSQCTTRDEWDDEEIVPYGVGMICDLVPILDENPKKMSFIGFYENKDSEHALHVERETKLQKRGRVGSESSGTRRSSKRAAQSPENVGKRGKGQ